MLSPKELAQSYMTHPLAEAALLGFYGDLKILLMEVIKDARAEG